MELTALHIKEIAHNSGFELCSITKIENISEQQNKIEQWISKGYNGTMTWFLENQDIRVNPTLLVENGKSIIVCAKFYNPDIEFGDNPKISKYALSKDYHYTMRYNLNILLEKIQQKWSGVNGRAFVDSAPLLERFWAEKSGIGWVGKNGLITTQKYGSLINLGFLIIDREIDLYDNPIESKCGECKKCLDNCPTSAFTQHGIDARKCLSYLTIEHKGELSEQQVEIIRTKSDGNIFGCDICLNICKWNIKALKENEHTHTADMKFNLSCQEWNNLSSNQFNKRYRDTALYRAGVKNIKRNIEIIFSGNNLGSASKKK